MIIIFVNKDDICIIRSNDFCKLTTVDKPPYPAPNTKIVGLFTKIETTFNFFMCRVHVKSDYTDDLHSPGICLFSTNFYLL